MFSWIVGLIDEDDIELEGILAEIGEISFAGVTPKAAVIFGDAAIIRVRFFLEIISHKLFLVGFWIGIAITLKLYEIEEFYGEYRIFVGVDLLWEFLQKN